MENYPSCTMVDSQNRKSIKICYTLSIYKVITGAVSNE